MKRCHAIPVDRNCQDRAFLVLRIELELRAQPPGQHGWSAPDRSRGSTHYYRYLKTEGAEVKRGRDAEAGLVPTASKTRIGQTSSSAAQRRAQSWRAAADEAAQNSQPR